MWPLSIVKRFGLLVFLSCAMSNYPMRAISEEGNNYDDLRALLDKISSEPSSVSRAPIAIEVLKIVDDLQDPGKIPEQVVLDIRNIIPSQSGMSLLYLSAVLGKIGYRARVALPELMEKYSEQYCLEHQGDPRPMGLQLRGAEVLSNVISDIQGKSPPLPKCQD